MLNTLAYLSSTISVIALAFQVDRYSAIYSFTNLYYPMSTETFIYHAFAHESNISATYQHSTKATTCFK